MRKKCYNCEKTREGSVIESGVFVCFRCQKEADDYGNEERQEQFERLGPDRVNEINLEE
jgi:hypothetical protein